MGSSTWALRDEYIQLRREGKGGFLHEEGVSACSGESLRLGIKGDVVSVCSFALINFNNILSILTFKNSSLGFVRNFEFTTLCNFNLRCTVNSVPQFPNFPFFCGVEVLLVSLGTAMMREGDYKL